VELDEFFKGVGGVQTVRSGGDPNDPGDVAWNFGVAPATPVATAAHDGVPFLYDRFPSLQGKWDGKSIVNHHEAVRKVLGADIKAHQQPRGTCGSRAGSRGAEILQCIMIVAGLRAKFKYVSHAWIYYLARREYQMLGGGDGVASGSVPPVLEKHGLLTRDEASDPLMAGSGSDDLAVKWGAGRITAAEREKFTKEASDNLITARVRVRSAQELADGIASGGVGVCSDAQGYSMARDNEGFCRPSGTWYHYHVRSGIHVSPRGRKGFVYDQSWGDGTPDGPLVPGCPGNCFGVDYDVQDQLCRSGDVDVIFGMNLWDLEAGRVDIPWIFK
jgi:hypothetical protein